MDINPHVSQPNSVLLGQSSYEGILREHLAKFNIHVELGTELTHFEHDANGVTAHVLRHENGEAYHETISAEWLVSAEGGKSKLPYFSFVSNI
jgi:2-polyprenyl-6-methoxyphenol hydroxylase-like FAD-dependent oxidoreductase